MAPEAGFEPATDRLTADCTTAVLLWNARMVGDTGLEPVTFCMSSRRSNQAELIPRKIDSIIVSVFRASVKQKKSKKIKHPLLSYNDKKLSFFRISTFAKREYNLPETHSASQQDLPHHSS